VKTKEARGFENKSVIKPPFKSIALEIEIPSISNSVMALETVYLNNAVLLSLWEM